MFQGKETCAPPHLYCLRCCFSLLWTNAFLIFHYRLTFWWSNTVVLREIISQAFGNSNQSSLIGRVAESNGNGKRNEGKPLPQKWNGSAGYKQVKKLGFMQFVDDWQETSTFTAALEKIESWIFSRIIESVWWQVDFIWYSMLSYLYWFYIS